jgi:hypothetical protein
MKLVPVCDFTFMNYDGPMREGEEKAPAHATLTCINHQDLRWSTKDPYQRSIHYLGPVQYVDFLEGKTEEIHIPEEMRAYLYEECKCTFHDLRVIVEEK